MMYDIRTFLITGLLTIYAFTACAFSSKYFKKESVPPEFLKKCTYWQQKVGLSERNIEYYMSQDLSKNTDAFANQANQIVFSKKLIESGSNASHSHTILHELYHIKCNHIKKKCCLTTATAVISYLIASWAVSALLSYTKSEKKYNEMEACIPLISMPTGLLLSKIINKTLLQPVYRANEMEANLGSFYHMSKEFKFVLPVTPANTKTHPDYESNRLYGLYTLQKLTEDTSTGQEIIHELKWYYLIEQYLRIKILKETKKNTKSSSTIAA